MKKLSTILIASVLVLLIAALYVTFINPISIDKTCAGFTGELCGKGFYCKMPKVSPGSADIQGLCVPYHLALLPYKAFVFDSSSRSPIL